MAAKKKSVWDVDGLEKHIASLVHQGVLNKQTVDELWAKVKKDFSVELKEKGRRLTKKIFAEKVEELIWTKETLRSLEDAERFGVDASSFHSMHPHISLVRIEKKVRELRGVSRTVSDKEAAQAQAGVNRLTYDLASQKDMPLPSTTFEKPFVISVKNKKHWIIAPANAPHVGLVHNRIIEENPLRCQLEKAEETGVDAVLFTGGLFFLDAKQAAGYTKAHKALLSGSNFNDAVLSPLYQEKARRIKESRKSGKGKDFGKEMAYVTLTERFMNLLGGFKKIVLRPDGTPEYNGPSYVVFGGNEEELVEATAYAEYSYWTRYNQQRIAAIIRMLNRKKEKTTADEKQILQLEDERRRTIVSNVEDEEVQWYVNKVRSFFIQKVEETIPNSKVIGAGKTYVRCGNKVIAIEQWRSATVSDGVLNDYILKATGNQALAKTLPDAVLLCHPYSLRADYAVAERSFEGKRKSSQIFQLPCILDKDFLRKKLRNMVRKKSPIENLIQHEQFEPGAEHLVCSNDMMNMESLGLPFLKNTTATRRKERKAIAELRKEQEYIYLFVETDTHWGHPWKTFYYDRQNHQMLGCSGAIIEMMRREGLMEKGKLPLHGFHLLDDGVQGHHFATQSQPHQHKLPFIEAERHYNALLEKAKKDGSPKAMMGALETMRDSALKQLRLGGEHWTQSQLQEYCDRFLDQNTDFFGNLLLRSQKSGVIYRGVGHYLGEDYDTRDIGPITLGNGNHMASTVEREVTEGFVYRMHLAPLMQHHSYCSSFEDKVGSLIKSPLDGNEHIGLGTVSVGGMYEWGLSLRSNPARKSGMGDPLRNMAKNVQQRGDFPLFLAGRYVVWISGDIHRYGKILIPGAAILSCASGTDSDPYGQRGFSLNNTGNMIVGLPAGGPGSGPIRVLTFRHDWIEEYFEKPRKINWDLILPNAV